MTNPTDKQLAEFAAEFVGLTPGYMAEIKVWDFPRDNYGPTGPIGDIIYDTALVREFFNEAETAPILMHLGKREMERREFNWDSYSRSNGYFCSFTKGTFGNQISGNYLDDNEFIAFWSAVREAVEDV